jgi:hypothetical protein
VQNDFHHRAIFDVAQRTHQARSRAFAINREPSPNAFQGFRWRVPIEQRFILLLDLEPRMHHPVRDLAVVCQQQQPLRLPVEASDWHDSLINGHKVHNGVPAALVGHRRDIPAWLVQQDVAQSRAGNQLAVHLDLLPLGVHLGAELRHDVTINPHAALDDHLLGTSP